MILEKIIQVLSEHLDCYVGVQAPETTTGYVLIDQTGSNRQNYIITTTVAIQSYGQSLMDAITLNRQVEQAMLGELIKDDIVSAVKLETDYNFTDTTTKQYRWQAVYHITHYMEV